MPATKPDRKQDILGSAASILSANGLTTWSIDRCAQDAKCTKGLVLHYFKSKEALLGEVARTLCGARRAEWVAALSTNGIDGLDTLWERLAAEANSLRARALIELRLAGISGTSLSALDAAALRRQLGTTLEISPEELPTAEALEPLLEGYLLALLQGVPAEAVREAFFRYWLSYVR